METVTIGVLAHVDAGKTSLTERLLHTAGAIDRLGSVDRGDTRTDSLALERARGITIRSAVASLVVDGVQVDLVDTPGHPDFIAEVERALTVLDGVVLVVSAVEGVQAQTRLLMRTLDRLGTPTLVFVNKIDRTGARSDELIAELRAELTPDAVALAAVTGAGTREATVVALPVTDRAVVEALAERDDPFLARYLEGPPPTAAEVAAELARQTAAARLRPVFLGSAATGAGIDGLVAGVVAYLPRPATDPAADLRATVFAIARGPGGDKLAYARVRAGTLTARTAVPIHRPGTGPVTGRITGVAVFAGGAEPVAGAAPAGSVAVVRGLREVRIGDRLGVPDDTTGRPLFPPPALESVVTATRPGATPALWAALQELADQDPLIDVRRDAAGDIAVSLYGEVQKEVLQTTLADVHGVEASFAATRVVYAERLVGAGEALEEIGTGTDPGTGGDTGNGEPVRFCATIGLRVEPGAPGTGVVFTRAVELGALPAAFHTAIEETARATLRQGLRGWPVLDVRVTLVRTGYASPVSVARDFRRLTPLVLMAALRRAGTCVVEPVHRFELDVPPATVAQVLPALAAVRAVPDAVTTRGTRTLVQGTVPAAGVHALGTSLPGVSHGSGVLVTRPEGHRRVTGAPPTRARTDGNPLDRREYLLHVLGTVR